MKTLPSEMSSGKVVQTFPCKICSKCFSKPVYLKKHMFIHTSEKRFKCEFCSKVCLRNGDLKKHMMRHTGEKHHQCEVCAKTFFQWGHLKDHMLVHTGAKPINCSICLKRFKDNRSMRRHILVHTGEKPLRCLQCEKVFKQIGSLRTHMLVVHCGERAYACGDCSKSYTLMQSLREHMKVHAGEKKTTSQDSRGDETTDGEAVDVEETLYQCNDCFKCFSQQSVLERHTLVHLKEESLSDAEGEKSHTSVQEECIEDLDVIKSHVVIQAVEERLGGEGVIRNGDESECVRDRKMTTHTDDIPIESGDCSQRFLDDCVRERPMLGHVKEKTSGNVGVSKIDDYLDGREMGDKPFNCGLCSKSFHDDRARKIHMLVHVEVKHSERVDVTSKSNKYFANSGTPMQYLSIETNDKPFACGVCSQFFSQECDLEAHISEHVDDSNSDEDSGIPDHENDKPFECGVCCKRFSDDRDLEEHILNHTKEEHLGHVDTPKSNEYIEDDGEGPIHASDKPFECGICCRSFLDDRVREKHMLDHAKDEEKHLKHSDASQSSGYLEDSGETDGKPFECGICCKSFLDDRVREKHMQDHAEEKEEDLDDDVDFTGSGGGKYSEDGEMLMPFKCGVCYECFSEESILRQHMQYHTEVSSLEASGSLPDELTPGRDDAAGAEPARLFRCGQCSKRFPSSQSLSRHMPVHTGVRQFECDLCTKSFTLHNYLKAHKRVVHNDRKPFACGVCSKMFAFNATLKTHMLVHSGQQPFQCENCSKTFSLKGNLKRHVFLHCNEII